ncbi:MAG TPA: terpene synthase family protein [Polyangiaceae bacterium]|jgi:hypothetical protein|nr:terpene synthase family protein [Polyangiaceae bacterium]
MKSSTFFDGEILAVLPAKMIPHVAELAPTQFKLMIPRRWKPEVEVNRNAKRIEEATLAWFSELGCTDRQIAKVRKFQPSLYMGMSFPLAGEEEALLISKYLSLWLLWDDVAIENQENAWKITAHHVLSGELPDSATIFDIGWWRLLRQLAITMSPAWIERLCQSMTTWSDAALREARISLLWNAGARVTLEDALQSRIDTIGMYATAYLIEYAIGFELPRSFHEHETVRRIKTLANKIVGLGNDIFSFGKDYAQDYINVISALRKERAVPMLDALNRIVDMHNDALIELDYLAGTLPSFGPAIDSMIAKWLQWLRYNCIGFSVWESVAPRYSDFKLVVNGRLVETSFSYYSDSYYEETRRPVVSHQSELRELSL